MTNAIQICRTTANDGALLRQLRIAALTDAPYAFGARFEDELAKPLASFDIIASRHACSETSTSFFAFIANVPIGMIGAFQEQYPPFRSFICSLWLEPAHRGTSAATKLVQTACSWLRRSSEQDVFAWVSDCNHRAQAFYRKLDFIPTTEHQPLPSNPYEYETLLCRASKINPFAKLTN